MRLIFFYIFLLSQLLNFLNVFAEKLKKESSDSNFIKWEKVKEENTDNSEIIIWKSYNDDESYFENIDSQVPKKSIKNFAKDKKNQSTGNLSNSINEIDTYLPLNNFIESGKFEAKVEWRSSFDGGEARGTGQQNNSFQFIYGLRDLTQLTLYFSEADDFIYNKINNKDAEYFWQIYALSLKKSLFSSKNSNLALSLVSTIEYWRSSSGSITSKSIFNEIDNNLGKDKYNNFISSFSLPISKEINNKFTILLVPGITFLPDKMGNKTNRNNYYGNNFYIGAGIVLEMSENINLFASYTNPLGPGNNYFDKNLNFSRKSLYSFGVNLEASPRISLEGKITNSYGATPSTGLLTIPSDNLPLYSASIVYKPSEDDIFLETLQKKDELLSLGGITVSNALIPAAGSSQINLDYDASGNLMAFYGYSLSNIFQLEIINIGTFKDVKLSANSNQSLQSNYLSKNNLNYRVGGKFLILSPQKNDSFWMALRTSVGRNDETNQGYLYSELINTFRLNDWIALNISPRYFFSGVESFGGLGVSSYIDLFENMQFIAEINTSLKNNSDLNSTFAFRYSYQKGRSIDLYYSNAVGTQDLGQLLRDPEGRFGIKLNFSY